MCVSEWVSGWCVWLRLLTSPECISASFPSVTLVPAYPKADGWIHAQWCTIFCFSDFRTRLPGGRRRESRANSTFLLNPTLSTAKNSSLPGPSITKQHTETRYAANIIAVYLKMGSNWIQICVRQLNLEAPLRKSNFFLQRWTCDSVVNLCLRVTRLSQPVSHFYYIYKTYEHFFFYITTCNIMQKCHSYD